MKALIPLTAAIRKRLGLSRGGWRDKYEMLEAESEVWHPPAISLPEEHLRARRLLDTLDPGEQLRLLRGGTTLHGPTLLYRLSNVLLEDGAAFLKGSIERCRPRRRGPFQAGPYLSLPECLLCSSFFTESYFGHWIHEALPLELLAGTLGVTPVAFSRSPWLHEYGYRGLLGLTVQLVESGWAEKLLWIDNPWNPGRSKRLRMMRERVRSQLPAGDGPSLVYIRRGVLGARRVLRNEAQILEVLTSRGFSVLEPEAATADEILRCLGNAVVVINVEGSAQSHALLCAPPGCVRLTIQPPHRFNPSIKLVTEAAGQHFAYVVGDPAGEGFVLPVDRLLHTLDLALDEASRRPEPYFG